MTSPGADPHLAHPGRRKFFSRAVAGIQATIVAALTFVLGGTVLGPAFASRSSNWWPAGDVSDLLDGEPTPVTIRRVRPDGYTQTIDRQVVFLIKNDARITALSSTCTHLGCRVRWDAEASLLKCPCHGGAFDLTGAVKAGPPPAPLASLPTRVENDRVFVQI